MRKRTLLLSFALASCAAAADMTVARLYDSQLSAMEEEVVPLVKAVPEPAFGFAPKQGALATCAPSPSKPSTPLP